MSIERPGELVDGLPVSGPGSPAGWGRRIAALLVDWILANALAFAAVGLQVWDPATGRTWIPLLCWFGLVVVSTAASGASLGQRALRLRVVRLDRRRVGVPRALLRTALIALVIPPLISTRQGRGLHDLAAGTAAVNGPR